MDIVELAGQDHNLYPLVAHLVMDDDVLSYNQNYPFRTSERYRWFVALENKTTVGFIPVKVTSKKAVINNYYIEQDQTDIFTSLLDRVILSLGDKYDIESISQIRHVRFFERQGFSVCHYWTKYAKMNYCRDGEEECI